MQYAEKKKQDAILKKQAEHAEALRKRRESIEVRIENNMEMAKAIEEKKKADFLAKQDQFEAIRLEHLRRQEEERTLKAQELELQEQRRKMILLQQRKEEEAKAEGMLEKFESEEEHLAAVQARRDKDMYLAKERKSLKTQLKLENVQRVMRINDYRRMSTQKKIHENDQRISKMVEQRAALVEERRRAAIATKQQKESLSRVMDEVRTNASKASQIITKVLSGKLTLDQLAAQGGAGASKRSKSATKRRPGDSHGGSPMGGEALGLGRKTQSAGRLESGPPAGSESPEGLKYSLQAPAINPQQYVSPYAIPAGQV